MNRKRLVILLVLASLSCKFVVAADEVRFSELHVAQEIGSSEIDNDLIDVAGTEGRERRSLFPSQEPLMDEMEEEKDIPEMSPESTQESNSWAEAWDDGITGTSNQSSETFAGQRAAGTRLKWNTVKTRHLPMARHEACYVRAPNGNHYLIGGRRKNNVGIFNPVTRTWTSAPGPGVEIHHMQCVVSGDGRIWIPTSWYGGYPREKNHASIFIFNTKTKKWSRKPGLPAARRRGSASAVIRGGMIYVSHGNRYVVLAPMPVVSRLTYDNSLRLLTFLSLIFTQWTGADMGVMLLASDGLMHTTSRRTNG